MRSGTFTARSCGTQLPRMEQSAGSKGLSSYRARSPGVRPNPYMASSVNRRTAECGSFLSLPRRYNRTAVDRLAYGCMGLSPNGVSVSLHQTLIQGSAALAFEPRRLRDQGPTPKKLIRTPMPALQNGGLSPEGRPS